MRSLYPRARKSPLALAFYEAIGGCLLLLLLAIVCTSTMSRAGQIMPGEWESGAVRAAEELGCKRVIWQLRGEKFEQAVVIYAHRHLTGDCLILEPHHGGTDYFLGYAGQFEGRITNDVPSKWPGVPVFYVSDNPLVVLTRGLVPEITYSELQAGALHPARDFGCERILWNPPGEQMKQILFIQEPGYLRGDEADCLILQPHQDQDAGKYVLPSVNGDKRPIAPVGCPDIDVQGVRSRQALRVLRCKSSDDRY
jgi:hypothetical protein